MNTATTATLSARQLAFRAAKREKLEARFAPVVTALFGAIEEAKFEKDANGRVYRANAATDAEIADLLRGNRVIDSFELWEGIGKDAVTKLIANGSLKRSANHCKHAQGNLYWITTKAAAIYGIPAHFQLPGGAWVDLIAA